jgi:hypothetical protein
MSPDNQEEDNDAAEPDNVDSKGAWGALVATCRDAEIHGSPLRSQLLSAKQSDEFSPHLGARSEASPRMETQFREGNGRTVEHGNRTRQGRPSASLTGFEDRAGHQARLLYRRLVCPRTPRVSTPGARPWSMVQRVAPPSRVLSWVERLFAALLIALAFTAAVMTFVISPKIRLLVHEAGGRLTGAAAVVLSPAWWPCFLAALALAAGASIAARSAAIRRTLIAAGLTLGAVAFTAYAQVLTTRADLKTLLFERDPLAPREPVVPRQLDPDR